LDRNLYALPYTGRLSRGDCGQTFILGLLARLTPLGLVLQALVMKEHLFAAGPDEVFATVDTIDCAILVLGLGSL